MSLIFRYEKNISRSNFKNLVGQFEDNMLVKICVNFQLNTKKFNAQETFLLLCFFCLISGCLGNNP